MFLNQYYYYSRLYYSRFHSDFVSFAIICDFHCRSFWRRTIDVRLDFQPKITRRSLGSFTLKSKQSSIVTFEFCRYLDVKFAIFERASTTITNFLDFVSSLLICDFQSDFHFEFNILILLRLLSLCANVEN